MFFPLYAHFLLLALHYIIPKALLDELVDLKVIPVRFKTPLSVVPNHLNRYISNRYSGCLQLSSQLYWRMAKGKICCWDVKEIEDVYGKQIQTYKAPHQHSNELKLVFFVHTLTEHFTDKQSLFILLSILHGSRSQSLVPKELSNCDKQNTGADLGHSACIINIENKWPSLFP